MGVPDMRILVYPHAMEIGGSQLNAVQLAGAVRDRGHEVIVFSEPGPLVEKVTALGLEHIEIPLNRRRPSPDILRKLTWTVQQRQIDVVHGYEWPPVIEGVFGPGLRLRTPVVGTVMSMSVVPFFPGPCPSSSAPKPSGTPPSPPATSTSRCWNRRWTRTPTTRTWTAGDSAPSTAFPPTRSWWRWCAGSCRS
ncbi:hypothetical protein GCM10029964_117680 [Kibdelosporangium lantanae]